MGRRIFHVVRALRLWGVAALLAMAGCAQLPPLDSYPWAVPGERCETIVIGSSAPTWRCVEGRGDVRTSDGSAFPLGSYFEVTFASPDGALIMYGNDAQFDFTVDQHDMRLAWSYQWSAVVRAGGSKGPVIYRSPKPQPFRPDYPIVVAVDPVPAEHAD